jgi:RNA recognition motif. (a.k.a. RRM, RBD, or RNP domain)
VKSLPITCDKGQLHSVMSAFGPVDKSFVLYNHKDGSSRGFGFVEFHDIYSAEKAAKQGKVLICNKLALVQRAVAKNDSAEDLLKHPEADRSAPSGRLIEDIKYVPRNSTKKGVFIEDSANYELNHNRKAKSVSRLGCKLPIELNLNRFRQKRVGSNQDELECNTCESTKANYAAYQPNLSFLAAQYQNSVHDEQDTLQATIGKEESTNSHAGKRLSMCEDMHSQSASPDVTILPEKMWTQGKTTPYWALSFRAYLKVTNLSRCGEERGHSECALRFNVQSAI